MIKLKVFFHLILCIFFSVFSATSGVNDKISVNAEETKAMKKNIR